MFCLRCTMTPDGMGHPIILCPDTDNEEMGRVKSWIGTFPFASSLRKGRIWANNAPSTWIKYLSLSRITSSSTATTCITNNNNNKKKRKAIQNTTKTPHPNCQFLHGPWQKENQIKTTKKQFNHTVVPQLTFTIAVKMPCKNIFFFLKNKKRLRLETPYPVLVRLKLLSKVFNVNFSCLTSFHRASLSGRQKRWTRNNKRPKPPFCKSQRISRLSNAFARKNRQVRLGDSREQQSSHACFLFLFCYKLQLSTTL